MGRCASSAIGIPVGAAIISAAFPRRPEDGRSAQLHVEVDAWIDGLLSRSEVIGWPTRDDATDLRALCSNPRPVALDEAWPLLKFALYPGLRFLGRRSHVLVLPRQGSTLCSCLRATGSGPSCPGAEPFLNVIVVHQPTIQPFGVLSADWLAAEILPAFEQPLRVIPVVVGPGAAFSELPALNNSLLVIEGVQCDHGFEVEFDFGGYVEAARAGGGVRNLGLLHLNHEVLWESEGPREDFGSLVSARRDGSLLRPRHYLEAYRPFTYVLRNYYSPAYSRRSTYIPLGTKDASYLGISPSGFMEHWNYSFLPQDPRAAPLASTRAALCIATLGAAQDPTGDGGWYKWNRGELLDVLRAAPGLCRMTTEWRHGHKEALLGSALSLCPFGSGQETYRLWESVLTGSIVVTTRAAFIEQELGAPFLVLEHWAELPRRLAELDGQPGRLDALQEQQTTWFLRYMRDLRARVRKVGRTAFRAAVAEALDDA